MGSYYVKSSLTMRGSNLSIIISTSDSVTIDRSYMGKNVLLF